tara:strand:- start:1017 stop:1145 length:129 start_codon:yes stop_codon:yes gene_type:complete
MLLKNGVETKIVGIRKNLRILKFKVSFFVLFNIDEVNFKKIN